MVRFDKIPITENQVNFRYSVIITIFISITLYDILTLQFWAIDPDIKCHYLITGL